MANHESVPFGALYYHRQMTTCRWCGCKLVALSPSYVACRCCDLNDVHPSVPSGA